MSENEKLEANGTREENLILYFFSDLLSKFLNLTFLSADFKK